MWEQCVNRRFPPLPRAPKGAQRFQLNTLSFGEACEVRLTTDVIGEPQVASSPPLPTLSSDNTGTCQVQWNVICDGTSHGDKLVILGSDPALGCWEPSKGQQLSTTPTTFPEWRGYVSLPVGETIRWKLGIVHMDGTCTWENVDDHQLAMPSAATTDTWVVDASFGGDARLTVFLSTGGATANQKASPAAKEVEVVVRTSIEPPKETTLCWDMESRQQCVVLELSSAMQHAASSDAMKTEVCVVFEALNSRHELCYDAAQEVYKFLPAAAGIPQGMHSFYFTVDGAKTLSKSHAVADECNVMLLQEDLCLYAYNRSASSVEPENVVAPKRQTAEVDLVTMERRQTQHLTPEVLKHNPCGNKSPKRPWSRKTPKGFMNARFLNRQVSAMSVVSSISEVSTCTSMSEVDKELGNPEEDANAFSLACADEASPLNLEMAACADGDEERSEAQFSEEVFQDLFGLELRLFLDGKLLPKCRAASTGLRIWAGAERLEKPGGKCEDAFFISPYAAGVADGVGAMANYARYGVDAAAFSAELMDLSAKALAPGGGAAEDDLSAAARAGKALAIAETDTTTYGASTALVCCLDPKTSEVGVVNLGDSGFMLLRKTTQGMTVITRSMELQHSWNLPYQLIRVPPQLAARLPKGTKLDTAADSEAYKVPVESGDLLLLFTDGFGDNLYEHEVLQIVDRALNPLFGELLGIPQLATDPTQLAQALAQAARERSCDPDAKVPFMQSSARQGLNCPGGKVDDITVVAAWVVS